MTGDVAFDRWIRSIRWMPPDGPGRGDIASYATTLRCPLVMERKDPEGCAKAWRQRVDRAKAFIAEWNEEKRVAALAAQFDAEDVRQVVSQVWREVYDNSGSKCGG